MIVVTVVMITLLLLWSAESRYAEGGFEPKKSRPAIDSAAPTPEGGKFLGLASIRTARLPKFLRDQIEAGGVTPMNRPNVPMAGGGSSWRAGNIGCPGEVNSLGLHDPGPDALPDFCACKIKRNF